MEQQTLLPLLLITALAVAVPLATSRLRWISLPIVVGEILAGMVIGHSGFNLVETSPTLDFLKGFGFAFLMFLSGLEIDFNLLTGSRRTGKGHPWWHRPLPMAGLLFAGTLVLGVLSGLVLGGLGVVDNPLLMGLILSTTSLGVVVPVLKERGLLRGEFGQLVLVEASIADFVTLVLLTVVIALGRPGPTLDLLLIPLLLALFLIAATAVQRVAQQPLLKRLLDEVTHATSQIRVRAALAFMVAWVVLAQALGVELILGAFLAGAVAGLLAGDEESASRVKLDAIGYGFFVPIFFIMVGVDFNLSALVSSPSAIWLVLILVGLSYLVKVIPALGLRLLFPWRETLAAGVLLSSRLSLIIAAAAIALQLGVINEAVNASIVLLAVVTTTLSPMVFGRLCRAQDGQRRQGIILVGSDQITEYVARRLSAYDEPVTLLCPGSTRLHDLEAAGVTVVIGTTQDEAQLGRIGAERARALIDLTHTNQATLDLCRLASERFEIPIVISRIGDVDLVPQLQAMGVKVVQPALATAMALEGALRYPTVFDVLVHESPEVEVGEVILANASLVNLRVREVRLPGNALIVSLERDATIMVPHGDTKLKMGDRIDLIGSPDAVQRSADLLRG